MRKIAVRIDPGYTQLSNLIVDDDRLCIVDMGLLLKLHRCVDGYDITVQSIADKHSDPSRRGTGYAALEAAMRNVVQRGYVIKIKHQDDAGHWRTVFAPFNRVATPAHVAAMLEELEATEGPVRAYRVEPAWLDTRESADTKPDLRECPETGMPATDPALTGSRSAGSRQEPSSIRTEDGNDQTNDHTNPSRPSVTRPRVPKQPGAREGVRGERITETAVRRPRSAAPQPASAGVSLLVEIGRQIPALAFSGPWLTAQGRRLDALLDAGWTAGELRQMLTASLPDIVERPAAFVRARIDGFPAEPAPIGAGDVVPRDPFAPDWGAPGAPVPSSTLAAGRSVAEATGRRIHHECAGDDGMCGRQVPVEGALCAVCRGGEDQ